MNERNELLNRPANAGFAIPAAIFVIAVLSLLALSGLYIAQNDAAANDGIRRSWKAFYAANAGAARTIATWDPATYAALEPGDSVDTGWQTLPDGSQYRTTVLRVDNGAVQSVNDDDNDHGEDDDHAEHEDDEAHNEHGHHEDDDHAEHEDDEAHNEHGHHEDDDHAEHEDDEDDEEHGEHENGGVTIETGRLYRLRTIGRPGPRSTAQRAVVTFVRALSAGDFCCESALKVWGRVRIQGTGNVAKADGRDVPPSGWVALCSGTAEDMPGIRIRESEDLTLTGNPKIYGSPPVLEDEDIGEADFSFYDELAGLADKTLTGDQHLTDVGAVVTGGACDTSAPTNWGDPLHPGSACWSYVPVIHVAGDLSLGGNAYGQGILLVDGDLQITGNFDFYGVIVVKGQADLGGTPRVNGGLIVQNGSGGSGLSRLRGNEGVHYSSCVVKRALAAAAVARPLSGRHWFEVLK